MSGLPVPTTTVCAAALAAATIVAIAEKIRRQHVTRIRFISSSSRLPRDLRQLQLSDNRVAVLVDLAVRVDDTPVVREGDLRGRRGRIGRDADRADGSVGVAHFFDDVHAVPEVRPAADWLA